MKKYFIKTIAVCAAAMLLLALAGCVRAPETKELAEEFDEAAVTAAAKDIVTLMNGGDYEAVAAMVGEAAREALSAEVLRDVVAPAIAEAGAYMGIERTVVVGTEDKKTGEDYATAIVFAEYEKTSHAFTVTFDTSMAIAGLYFK